MSKKILCTMFLLAVLFQASAGDTVYVHEVSTSPTTDCLIFLGGSRPYMLSITNNCGTDFTIPPRYSRRNTTIVVEAGATVSRIGLHALDDRRCIKDECNVYKGVDGGR